MKKLALVFIILIGGAGGAYYYFNVRKPIEKPTITQATISQGRIREVVKSTGSLEALRTMQVGSQVSGVVKAMHVDFNSIVHKGDLLAEIDPQLLQVQVQIQEANLAQRQGDIDNQVVQLEDAQRNLARQKQLFEAKLINQQTLEQAELTVKSRTTSLESAKKSLLTTQAALDSAKLNVSYTKIIAPIDGVVINRAVDTGVTVQASMTAPTFFTLATDLRSLKLTAGVDESEIGKVRTDMPVEFTVESYPGVRFSGTVNNVRLNASTANNVVTYPVWIDAPNPDLRLKPAMTANLDIIVGTEENVIRIPNQATRFRPTSEMYTALGLTPPTPGQGRSVARGENAGGPGATDAPAAGDAAGRRGGRAGDQAAAGAGAQTPGGQAAAGGARQRNQQGQAADGTQAPQGGQGAGQGQRGQGRGANGQAGGLQGGQRGQGAGGQGRGGNFGGNANMTPEQRAQMQAQFQGRGGAAGGRGAGGAGGRGAAGAGGGRGGGRGAGSNLTATPVELNADKIDDLFPPILRRNTNTQVWTWDEAKKELKEIRIVTGITDGQFSQLISGDVKVGQQVLTQITLPVSAQQRQQNIFGQQPQGRGGFGPAPAGGGGGAPGGGGAGPGGGGGGGGRGGGGRGGGF